MQERWNTEKYSQYVNSQNKNNKYKNSTCWYDGLYFQSKKELDDYLDHKRLLQAGKIAGFLWQGILVLVEGGSDAKKKAVTYRPDIIVFNLDGSYEFREDKGRRTKDYIIKEKIITNKYSKLIFKEV